MKILIYPYGCFPFHALSLFETPLGEIETAAISLADNFDALGHQTIVLTPLQNPPLSKPRYLSSQNQSDLPPVDLAIIFRGWQGAFRRIKFKDCYVWVSGDAEDSVGIGIGDPRVYSCLKGVIFPSEAARQNICSLSGFPLEKALVIHHGVNLKDYAGTENRVKNRLIYASPPSQNLSYLAPIYSKLKQKYPDLELHICPELKLPFKPWPLEVEIDFAANLSLKVFKELPGCVVHPLMLPKQLARELMKSTIFLHPTFNDYTGVKILEAQAAGCVPLAFSSGAIPEVMGEAGVLVKEETTLESSLEQFERALDALLEDQERLQVLSQKALQKRLNEDWRNRAEQLMRKV